MNPLAAACDQSARSDLRSLESVVELYRSKMGRLPRQEYGFRSLVEATPDVQGDARWTQLMDRVPLDPWQQPYRYGVNADLPKGYGIYSVGPDGVSASLGNDPDDIASWQEAAGQGHALAPAESPVSAGILAVLLLMFLGGWVAGRYPRRKAAAAMSPTA